MNEEINIHDEMAMSQTMGEAQSDAFDGGFNFAMDKIKKAIFKLEKEDRNCMMGLISKDDLFNELGVKK